MKKSYICVYACFVVKAVRLDFVADLSTEAFLGSLRRFAAFHVAPTKIYSDNKSNFKRADSELNKLYDQLESTYMQEQLQHWAVTLSCEWHTSLSRAPHFGGLRESAVKSMKRMLKKSLGEQILREDELQTYLVEAAAVMNRMPLALVSSEIHSKRWSCPIDNCSLHDRWSCYCLAQ